MEEKSAFKGGEILGIWNWLFKKQNEDLRKIVQDSAFNAMKNVRLNSGRETTEKMATSQYWYEGIIARNDMRAKDIIEKLKVVRDVNPDSSMAIWNILRLANNGHELHAETLNGRIDKGSTDYLNDLASRIGALYGGGTDQLINVLLLSAFTQGAIALEVELNESITEVVDFHAIDPFTLDYRRNKETGELELVQKQSNGDYKVLNKEQVFYYPIDPEIGDPYGRSPILPVLQIVFFQAEVLRDLKRVVHHQGYERFDISVVEEAIINNMPEHIKSGGPNEISNYVASYVESIKEQMEQLEPDSDFFHTDSVNVDMVGGAKGSMDARAVIDVINQQMVTSLKQLPILLGRNEGSTETHSTVQWQIYVAGINSIQLAIKRILERAYDVALQVKGRQLKAKIEFDPIRVNTRKTDAEAEEVETRVKIQQVNQGWITNDEAANEVVGHDAVGDPVQPIQSSSNQNPDEEEEADPPEDKIEEDEERVLKFSKKKRAITDFSIDIEEDWSNDLEKVLKKSFREVKKFLNDQKRTYINRLKEADDIPSRALADIQSFRSFLDREETPNPTQDFRNWAKINILFDVNTQEALLEGILVDHLTEAMGVVGSIVLEELISGMDFNLEDRRLLRWLSDRSRRESELIQGVTDEDVIMTLWDVVYEGQYSINKMSKALQETFAFGESRANTIARTEVITAGRAGQYHADLQSGIVIGKRWRSASQERTRRTHREANNQVVPFDEPFIVGGEKLMFPGDSSLNASAKNLINCRCWYKRILQGEEDEL